MTIVEVAVARKVAARELVEAPVKRRVVQEIEDAQQAAQPRHGEPGH